MMPAAANLDWCFAQTRLSDGFLHFLAGKWLSFCFASF
jgi:hypothetical protein